MNIRNFKQTDLAQLAEIYVKVYTAFDVGENWDIESATELMRYLSHQDVFLVAERNSVLVGATTCRIKPWWDGNRVVDVEIFVDPDQQKQGVGSKLLKEMLIQAQDKYSCTNVETYTFASSEFPLNWYKKMGFREIDEWVMIEGEINQVVSKL